MIPGFCSFGLGVLGSTAISSMIHTAEVNQAPLPTKKKASLYLTLFAKTIILYISATKCNQAEFSIDDFYENAPVFTLTGIAGIAAGTMIYKRFLLDVNQLDPRTPAA